MNVYYGWSKVNKIRKKEALSVIFENTEKVKDGYIAKFQDTVYIRKQTAAEEEDGKKQNRVLTEYNIFFDDKRINGSLEKILMINNQADRNNVSENVRLKIQKKLMDRFLHTHPDYKDSGYQLELPLE